MTSPGQTTNGLLNGKTLRTDGAIIINPFSLDCVAAFRTDIRKDATAEGIDHVHLSGFPANGDGCQGNIVRGGISDLQSLCRSRPAK